MLFHDPHALNRNSFTGEPDAPHDQWNEWDFALAEARQLIEDYTDSDGHLLFERDSDKTTVVASWRVNKVGAAKARLQKKAGDNAPLGGEIITELRLRSSGDDWPTIAEWAEAEAKKRGNPSR